MTLTFEWDEAKARKNESKHGISFVQACHVFSDLGHIDVRYHYRGREERFVAIGRANGKELFYRLHVARPHHTTYLGPEN